MTSICRAEGSEENVKPNFNELWKNIKNFSNYEISTFGNLRNKITNKHLNPTNRSGYLGVTIQNDDKNRKSMKIHRLVALTFLPNPENKYTVNHIDHNKSNNNIDNLEWATTTEQNRHKRKTKKEVQRLISSRKVWRIDKDTNELLELFETIRDASKWIFDNNLTTVKEFNNGNNIKTKICAVCRKKMCNPGTGNGPSQYKKYQRKTAFGFKWCYDKTDIDKYADEEWKDIPPKIVKGMEGYKISNYARVMNKTGRITEGSKGHHSGYVWVNVSKGYLLHRLVALVFIPNPDNKEQVNHIDGIKQNNIVHNLEWCTNQENQQHKVDIGLQKTKPIIQYDLNMNKIKEFKSGSKASKELNINKASISNCCRGNIRYAGGYIFKFKTTGGIK